MKDTQKQDDAINESCAKNSENIETYPPLLSMNETSKDFLKMFIKYMFIINCGVASSLSVIDFDLYKYPIVILIINISVLICNIVIFHYASEKIENKNPKIDSKLFNKIYNVISYIYFVIKFFGLFFQIFIFLLAILIAWSFSC